MELATLIQFPVTGIILVLTILTSVMAFRDPSLMEKLIGYPYREFHQKEWFRFISSGLVHANFIHLGLNMYVLFGFGPIVEAQVGSAGFFFLYLISLIAGSVPGIIRHRDDVGYKSLGASGAISGVMLAFILFYPDMPLQFILIPIPIKGWIMGVLFIVISIVLSMRGVGRINHDAHLFGALGGAVMAMLLNTPLVLDNMRSLIG
ncbi:rhomboid family intramembrane serine protease [Pontibacter sp. G13]|uniref:rhomboid family intramembrane serine protease n=1 Tax=Pontibacter sp. G13 TaxID=3074898 RepID=UPI00288BB8FC|nr:rhomboid family intramembrane serine protease [Pontibacter sp. G13]WNJ19999.1 rhomboid family intramembrane serine protease [Pontibacter sp. G13]